MIENQTRTKFLRLSSVKVKNHILARADPQMIPGFVRNWCQLELAADLIMIYLKYEEDVWITHLLFSSLFPKELGYMRSNKWIWPRFASLCARSTCSASAATSHSSVSKFSDLQQYLHSPKRFLHSPSWGDPHQTSN